MTSDNDTIDAQAAEWAVRQSAGPLDPADQATLDAWLEADPRHRGAWVRAQAALVHIDRISALVPKESWVRARPGAPTTDSPGLTRRGLLAAGLATIAVGTAGGAWWLWRRRGEVFETELGEVRRITLPDGSSMLLDSGSLAHVRFGEHRRDIELVRGQGLFDVTKDPLRPFVVAARDVSVRAVGTVFAVRAVDQQVAVTVTEGVVEVSDTSAPGAASPQKVEADERAVVSDAHGIEIKPVTPAQIERHLAWRDGTLSFDGEPLSDAVAEVNRHNVRQITIDDPTLAQRPVVGLFHSTDTAGFAQTVATALGAESSTDGDVIHLHARSR
jgi:transmembrane sensor